MKKIALVFTLLCTILLPMLSSAHPGHGETEGYTIIHYITEPVHVLPIIGTVCAVLLFVQYWLKKDQRRQQ